MPERLHKFSEAGDELIDEDVVKSPELERVEAVSGGTPESILAGRRGGREVRASLSSLKG